MAYSTPLFSQQSDEGIDVNTAYAAASTANLETPAPPLALGKVIVGTLDGKWVLCQAATATISKYDVCTISPLFVATQVTGLSAFGQPAGVAMATATTGQYLWVMTNGVTPGILSATASANVQLYTSTAAGTVGVFSSANFTRLDGVTLTTACATVGTNQGAILVNLRVFTSV